jgi:hypothetical protein
MASYKSWVPDISLLRYAGTLNVEHGYESPPSLIHI